MCAAPTSGPDGVRSDAAAPGAPAHERELAARLRQALASDSAALRDLVRRGAWTSASCLVGIGAVPTLVRIHQGVPSTQGEIPLLCPWDFSVRGSAQAWAALWRPHPDPGWHDLFALTKRGEFRIEGNLLPFMANLQYFKDLLAMPREATP